MFVTLSPVICHVGCKDRKESGHNVAQLPQVGAHCGPKLRTQTPREPGKVTCTLCGCNTKISEQLA